MIVFRDSSEFGPALRSTAEGLGIPAAAVEKDYWVSEILRAMSREFGNDFVFKGGTSLSKAYRIVERFSDVNADRKSQHLLTLSR
jgi:predicted nucleotidyltransferase component of viral defense system